jgi:hypothetical protein
MYKDTLSPGFRRVHVDGGLEREPRDGELFTIVERKGLFEYVSLPVFESTDGDNWINLVRPRLFGDWQIIEGTDDDKYIQLEDGWRQGWFVWRRLAPDVRWRSGENAYR